MPDNKKEHKTALTSVHEYLGGVDYPATKLDLIAMAKDNSASAEAMGLLENIADKEYSGPDDVAKEIEKL